MDDSRFPSSASPIRVSEKQVRLTVDGQSVSVPAGTSVMAASMMQNFLDPKAFPYLFEFTTQHVMRPDYDFGTEFGYGLTVILDGLGAVMGDARVSDR